MIRKIVSWEAHPLKDDLFKLQILPIFAGLDIGRFRHPSHLAVIVPEGIKGEGCHRWVQVASMWLDQEPYQIQIQAIEELLRSFSGKRCTIYYDATRGELEALREQNLLPYGWHGVKLTAENKSKLAGRLLLALEQDRLKLLPDERQKRSLLQVNALLQAEESADGHGEALTSLMLALEAARPRWSMIDEFLKPGRLVIRGRAR